MSNKLWPKKKISWLFDVIGSGTTPSASNEMYYDSPDMAWLNTGDLTDSYIEKTSKYVSQQALDEFSALTVFPKDSLVMAMYGATIGKLGITKYETTTNQACCVLAKPREVITKFIFYWLLGHRAEIINLSQGGGQPNISQGIIRNIRIAVPPVVLQNKIVTFIDKKYEEINQLIDKKEKMINLLEQQRQSIITEAVTKGLNPNVKMKDSGVEWIGEIPEHWSILALKHIASEKKNSFVDGPFGSDLKNEEYVDSGVPVIQLNNIKNGKLRVVNMNFVTEEKSEQLKRHIAYPGDLVIAKMASPIARSAVVPETYEKYVIVADCIKLKLKENYLNHYINYAMNTPFTIVQAESFANGTTRSRVNLSIIKKLKIPMPNFEEQKEIVSYLTIKVSEVNTVIRSVENQIRKLKEYRQSLIYEAVTGKIDACDMEND
ncbi:hypothetical protein CHH83_16260 [Bacillus sp. 7586-K]|nr:hypothetical protein CHH83_16260 [Bacillus sp. 7586-K]